MILLKRFSFKNVIMLLLIDHLLIISETDVRFIFKGR